MREAKSGERKALQHSIGIKTKAQVELLDITREVRSVVESSGIPSGICYLFVPHTTAGIMVNEGADPSVAQDITSQLHALVPQHNRYRHGEGNSPAHIKTTLVGSSETLLVEGGRLVLGTWQAVFFCEFDGPRSRTLLVRLMADKG
ncbi:secondary thiamine-phosphate synthase enzyme YjbQ [Chloroflexota bacterium]